MFDNSGGGRRFRKFNSCNLGWWHTYKHAAMVVWRTFAAEWWQPLWHFLYPDCQFHIKPTSFPSVLTHMLYMRIAYPKFKEAIVAIQQDVQTKPKMHILVSDLAFLCEYAIPVVCFHMFTMSLD
jgi:hypothetical protein